MSVIKLITEAFGGAVKVIQTQPFYDNRGFLSIPFRHDEFEALGLPTKFVQNNHSRSSMNVARGFHFQLWPPMGKLMRVTRGSAQIITVDIRRDSPTFLTYLDIPVSFENQFQVWAPEGFARGFYALEDDTEVQYQCTGMFHPDGDRTIRWDHPDIGYKWTTTNPILSEKDRNASTVKELIARGKL